MPAFPDVGSTTSEPSASVPSARPIRSTWLATRSFTLPLGFRCSNFTQTPSTRVSGVRGRTADVPPSRSGSWSVLAVIAADYRLGSPRVKARAHRFREVERVLWHSGGPSPILSQAGRAFRETAPGDGSRSPGLRQLRLGGDPGRPHPAVRRTDERGPPGGLFPAGPRRHADAAASRGRSHGRRVSLAAPDLLEGARARLPRGGGARRLRLAGPPEPLRVDVPSAAQPGVHRGRPGETRRRRRPGAGRRDGGGGAGLPRPRPGRPS